MINHDYADLVYRQHVLENIKVKKPVEQQEFDGNKTALAQFELKLPAADISDSVHEAFKHIPARK